MKLQPSRHCPACGNAVVRAAGLYRCKCGKSFDGDTYHEPHKPIRSYDRASPDTNFAPIDGRPIPLDQRIK